MIVSPERCQCLLGLQIFRRQQSAAALEEVEGSARQDCSQHEGRDPVPSVEERISHEQHYSEHQHLNRQEAKHAGGYGEARPFADIARDLRELDASEVNLLPRQMRSIFRHFAQELPNSATGLGCAEHLHA
jgi:hypothetical protein